MDSSKSLKHLIYLNTYTAISLYLQYSTYSLSKPSKKSDFQGLFSILPLPGHYIFTFFLPPNPMTLQKHTYRTSKAAGEISFCWYGGNIWNVFSRSCINPFIFRCTYNVGSHTGEIEDFMPYMWQGRLVFAPIFWCVEDQEINVDSNVKE